MIRLHPDFGELVVSDAPVEGGRRMIRNTPVALDAVLRMIDESFSTEDILLRHSLVLRADLVQITLLYALIGQQPNL